MTIVHALLPCRRQWSQSLRAWPTRCEDTAGPPRRNTALEALRMPTDTASTARGNRTVDDLRRRRRGLS
jgi:hypothetical protein